MTAQLDYIFFISGFSFLLMAVVLHNRELSDKDRPVWGFLVWFGLLHGINEFLDMLVISLNDGTVFYGFRLAVMLASFIMLCEFSRRSMKVHSGRSVGVWVYGPLLALAALGGFNGMSGLNATCRYALCLPGAVFAGLVIVRRSYALDALDALGAFETGRRWPLRLAGLAFFMYGLVAGLAVPAAALIPASVLNSNSFSAATGVLLQLLGILCALTAVLSFVIAYQQSSASAARWYGSWIVFVVVVLLLTGGFFLTNWRGVAADAEQRENMLAQATAIARMMSIENVRSLTFTAQDTTNPHFQVLRSQLVVYARAIRHRSIYTQALRKGRIVFGPESLAEDDHQASPPGTVYEQPTEENYEAFGTGKSFTEGPVTDEYGTFVSAFAPVLDPQTGNVLMLVGLDIDARDFQTAVVRARLTGIIFTLALSCILLIGIAILPLRHRLSVEQRWGLRHAEAFLFAALGIVATLGLAYLVNDFQAKLRRTIFLQLAGAQAGIVADAMSDISNYRMDGLVRFIQSAKHVATDEFRTYVSGFLKDGIVQPWAWIQTVPAGLKSQVEADERRAGQVDFTVFQKDGNGAPRPVEVRETYYTALCVEPLENTEISPGYDLGSDPVFRSALEASLSTTMVTATEPVALGPGNRGQRVLFVVQPVFENAPLLKQVRGFALAVVRLQTMLNKKLTLFGRMQPSVVIGLYHLKTGEAPQLLAASPLPDLLSPIAPDGSLSGDAAGLHAVFPLFAFGRAYALVVKPGRVFLAANPTWAGWFTLLVGFFVTAVLSVFIGVLNNRRAYLETQVGARTAELQEQRQQLEDVIVGTHVGTWQWNIQTGGFIVNECWAEIIGYRFDEIFPVSLEKVKEFVHPEDLPRLEQALDDTLQGLKPLYDCQYRMQRRDGCWVWVQDLGRVMQRSSAGKPLRMSGTHADITERKESERVVKETLVELKRSNSELEHFAYVASHDLQEPLRMVVSYLQLIKRRYIGRLDADADEFIGFAVDGAQRMQSLINDLLAYSRVGTRGNPFAPTDCSDAVHRALANLQMILAETGAQIDCGQLPTVLADSSQLVQLFQNLVGNALKYRGSETPRIAIGAELRENEWLFSVGDNGIGIEPRYFERIFVIFQRLHSRSQHSGTGIGLAVCKKIVERHGGIIWVSSEPGTGSTFYFTIPATGV